MGVIQDLWNYSEKKKHDDEPMNLSEWLHEHPQYKNKTPTETSVVKRKHVTTINQRKNKRFDSE